MSGLVKLTASFARKPGLSDDEFHKYWSEEHSRIFLSIAIAKRNVVKYVQFHADPAASARLAENGRVPVGPFDACVVLYGRTVEDLFAIFVDPEYLSVVVPHEKRFIDLSSAQFMIGYDEEKWSQPVEHPYPA